jgi:hypothetical protein
LNLALLLLAAIAMIMRDAILSKTLCSRSLKWQTAPRVFEKLFIELDIVSWLIAGVESKIAEVKERFVLLLHGLVVSSHVRNKYFLRVLAGSSVLASMIHLVEYENEMK